MAIYKINVEGSNSYDSYLENNRVQLFSSRNLEVRTHPPRRYYRQKKKDSNLRLRRYGSFVT